MKNLRVAHHVKMAKEAIKAEKPPKGLTPALSLTAYLETNELNQAVLDKMTKAGLLVCRLLKEHYSAIYHVNMATIQTLDQEINELPDTAEESQKNNPKRVD